MDRILALATRASAMVEQIRGRLLAPQCRKLAPCYSAAQIAALCGVDKAHVNYRVTKSDLPVGQLTPQWQQTRVQPGRGAAMGPQIGRAHV